MDGQQRSNMKAVWAAAILGAAGMIHDLPAAAQVQTAAPASPPSQQSACAPLLQHTFARLQDEKPQSLCQYSGKVILVVNTASFCGFTPQYKGLEALHAQYKDRGLVVLGFPSNDFSQEKGSNKEIADFCESTFGVKFPMFVKSSVRGPDASAFYKQLAAQAGGKAPAWNFHKYLLSRDGKVVDSYTSMVAPDNPSFIRDLEKQLAAK
ncbi:glutathione peroxidase [Variovorax sp. VNK109]|uniref:glutathione peroxidase n=1 Tax=Variovorax sp. VNK109 TaxID=3400919 RepID=UPI003C02ADC1